MMLEIEKMNLYKQMVIKNQNASMTPRGKGLSSYKQMPSIYGTPRVANFQSLNLKIKKR